MSLSAILNISKPIGWTSFDVVRWIKKKYPGAKVGHAGTLDPFAGGVLLLCVGKATKRISELVNYDKEYVATIELGKETDSLDISGQVIKTEKVPAFTYEQIIQVAKTFEGEIEQVPPAFSAVKHNGKRSYELARAGKEIENKARKIRIYELEILDYNGSIILIRVVCSKGTYIRVLARDMALKLSTVGYLRKLTRTRIGEYQIQSSLKLGDLKSFKI